MTTFGFSSSKCNGRGICIQNHEGFPTSSIYLCEPCSYGYICQFSTADYTLSLNAIIDSHVRLTVVSIFATNNSDSNY
ncbi:unnamed protein product [Rotaria sp. Silwood2]|nr:unnamed protein product [Rotaria sp. Silwood2]